MDPVLIESSMCSTALSSRQPPGTEDLFVCVRAWSRRPVQVLWHLFGGCHPARLLLEGRGEACDSMLQRVNCVHLKTCLCLVMS